MHLQGAEGHPSPHCRGPPLGLHALLLASHSLRSISRGSTTSSLNSKSVILDLVCSGSRYTFFSSAAGFLPLGLALDFLPTERGQCGHHTPHWTQTTQGPEQGCLWACSSRRGWWGLPQPQPAEGTTLLPLPSPAGSEATAQVGGCPTQRLPWPPCSGGGGLRPGLQGHQASDGLEAGAQGRQW